MEHYRILRLEAENYKRLGVVEITPEGDVIEITGANGEGKTSVLDSIWAALRNADHDVVEPIRQGADHAVIKLDLGRLKVKRTFTPKGTYLTVETEDGARYGSPQKILDGLIGALSFDPLAFSRMKPADQRATLKGLAKLTIDVDAKAAERARIFAERTGVNRDVANLRAQAAGVRFDDGLPDAPVDVDALEAQLAEAGDVVAEIERRKANRSTLAHLIEDDRRKAGVARSQAEELRRKAAEWDAEAERLDAEAEANQKTLDEAPPLPDVPDTAEIRRQLTEARTVNAGIALRERKAALEADADTRQAAADALTAKIEAIDAEIAEAIAAAELPVEGLSFDAERVLFNGVPYEQASKAEQLRIGMAIAAATNPKLRVIRIEDGSLLDDNSMKLVADFAQANDLQVWIERVDMSGSVGVVIEDGYVKGAPRPEPKAKPEPDGEPEAKVNPLALPGDLNGAAAKRSQPAAPKRDASDAFARSMAKAAGAQPAADTTATAEVEPGLPLD